ncbi:hypothetical protein Cni_G17131 [Canna indica]|uniref:Uncharacterized protein n=1 Tax=Canna indica TaxID=4628 RepID=A0AAQ3KK55_9LILI|nr:hypothetical protein Cni_G17131 [Canna indica]
MLPFGAHSRFFSSLKQVEDRLASEERASTDSKTRLIQTPPSSSDHLLSSPIFLDFPQPDAERTNPPPLQDSSGPPLNFLSSSSCPVEEQEHAADQEDQKPPPPSEPDVASENGEATDDIEQMMSLLGLTANEDFSGEWSSCNCSGGGFFSKVAGIRGPKCGKERKRLDGWIAYYYKEKKEPARLAHLLLAKALCSSGDNNDEEDGDGLGDVEFPLTVEEFLDDDPPDGE